MFKCEVVHFKHMVISCRDLYTQTNTFLASSSSSSCSFIKEVWQTAN